RLASRRRRFACSAKKRCPTSTTRTLHCCGSSSPTAARFVPVGSPETAPSTSATSPPRSRTPARWRCCPTPAPHAERAGGTPVKLILTQQVAGLGAPGDVVEVKGGYARNFLIPRGYAMRWTRGAAKQIESIRKARLAREIASLEQAQAVADELAALKIRLRTR